MKLRNYNQAQIDLRDHVLAGTVAMMWGPGGIGKSAIARDVASDLTVETGNPWGFIDTRPSLRESVDFRGLPVPDLATGVVRWLQPDDFPRVDRDGEYGVWMLDEINACSLPVQVALYQLIWDGCLGEYKKPKNWTIACAGNRVSDKAGALRMSTALQNRIAHIDVEADHLSWCDWAALNGIHPLMISYIRWRPEMLFKMVEGARAYPSPRSWTIASRYVTADRSRRLRLIGQIVGEEAAQDFEAFADVVGELQPVAYILANPTTANVPTPEKLAAAYATCVAVASNIDKRTAKAGAVYVKRLAPDFHALFAKLVMMRDPALAAYGFADLVAAL
jgi:hypothetical protein